MSRYAPIFRLSTLARMTAAMGLVTVMSACSMFGPSVSEEPIVPVDTLYTSAVENMEANRYSSAIEDLEMLERQHPYSQYNERAKVMITFANFQRGNYPEAVRAADRYLALFPNGEEAAYIMFLKGSSYFRQINDITRDQEFAQNALDTFQLLESTYPNSEYVDEIDQMKLVSADQLAGKEMSVGRYYLGNGQYTAAINRFRSVVEDHQTSTHVEEALYRLTEAYLRLGLINEARTAAAVLGTNYPTSDWYQRAFALLAEEGYSPQMVPGNWIAQQA